MKYAVSQAFQHQNMPPKLKNMYAVQWDFTPYITKN